MRRALVSRLPRVAGVLAAIGLSFAVVVSSPGRADAWGTATPVVIGTALRAAPTATAAVAGVCATGVGCLALGAVALGVTLYATHDTWMPWAEQWWEAEGLASPVGDAAYGCSVVLNGVGLSGANGLNLAANVVIGADCLFPIESIYPRRGLVGNRFCTSANPGTTGQPVGAVTNTEYFEFNPDLRGSGAFSELLPACPSGSRVGYIDIRARTQNGCAQNYPCGGSELQRVLFKAPAQDVVTQTKIDCIRPDGSTFPIEATETGHPERMPVPSCYAADPTSIPGSVTVGTGSGPLMTWTAPNYQSDYPNCFGPSGLVCETRVFIGEVPCEPGMVGCHHWWRDRNLEGTDYSCRFGPYEVGLGNCEPLKRAYPRTGTTTTTVTSPDGWPDPEPEVEPDPPTEPQWPPSTGTNPQTPTTDPDAQVDPDTRSCFGAAWSWNPVDWVYVPVKCSLIWAFVPSPGFLDAQLGTLRADWADTAPGGFVDAYASQDWDLDATGCGGIPVSWSVDGQGFSFDLLRACDGYMATTASIVKLAGSAGLVIFGGIACLRGVGAGFGWSPSLGRSAEA